MKGYWRPPVATAEAVVDGWLHTGDLARVDADGYFFIVDRKKDMIIRGGYNVYPREIEEVLYEHPAIKEVAVVGIPDEYLGEEIGAAVILRVGAHASRKKCASSPNARSRPTSIPATSGSSTSSLTGATGKILKREIQVPLGLGLEGAVGS